MENAGKIHVEILKNATVKQPSMGGGEPSFDLVLQGDQKSIVLCRGDKVSVERVHKNFEEFMDNHYGYSGYLCFPRLASDPKLITCQIENSNLSTGVHTDIHENVREKLFA